MFKGCYTALITPMLEMREVDYTRLEDLVDFQSSQRVSGILATGTTGESSTLTWEEHIKVIEKIHDNNDKTMTIAGTGSNSTVESINGTQHAVNMGIGAVLLVEPYYNGPSSLEIRREYIGPIASRFQDLQIIPYVIPGRTGTQLLPQDLAILHSEYANVSAVKEATGDLDNMKLTRELCSKNFDILSGDDDKTYSMMTDNEIKASGVISVASNVAPHAIQNMTELILEGNIIEANKMYAALKPLFNIVTVKTIEETSFGPVLVKARNPLPYKTLMNILGMPSGPLRPPLGKMTRKGIEIVVKEARSVYEHNPEILEPIESTFDVDLSERLYNEVYLKGLAYD
jgi:4-hydroxy-tetrahydrodipicolinate synthase